MARPDWTLSCPTVQIAECRSLRQPTRTETRLCNRTTTVNLPQRTMADNASASTSAPPPNIAPDPNTEGASGQELNESVPEPKEITDHEVGEYREQDRYLPVSMRVLSMQLGLKRVFVSQIANVARIMKNSVPPTAKIAKDAKEAVQECVSEFISFVTSEVCIAIF